MDEVDRICYDMGYYDSDPMKRQQVQGYIDEAAEYMRASGVPGSQLTSRDAYAVKSLWAKYRDEQNTTDAVSKEGMITHLILSLRRRA